MNRPIKYRNPSIKNIKDALEKMNDQFLKYEEAHNKVMESYLANLEDAIQAELTKRLKKISKKYNIPFAELHKNYIEQQISEHSPDAVKNSIEMTEEEIDNALTVDATELVPKEKQVLPSDEVYESIVIDNVTYFAEQIEDGRIFNSELMEVGTVKLKNVKKGKGKKQTNEYEYVLTPSSIL